MILDWEQIQELKQIHQFYRSAKNVFFQTTKQLLNLHKWKQTQKFLIVETQTKVIELMKFEQNVIEF